MSLYVSFLVKGMGNVAQMNNLSRSLTEAQVKEYDQGKEEKL